MMDEGFIKFKDYEDNLVDLAKSVIAKQRIGTLIDIGSNIGYYTVQLGHCPSIRRILSFEPIRKLYTQTSANVLINGLLDKWSGFNVALSDAEGKEIIHYHPFYMGLSSMDAQWSDRHDHTESVQTAVFDKLVPDDLPAACFIKIDVEGWEVHVLRGMRRFLDSHSAVIQIEANEKNFPAIRSLLEDIGYQWLGNPVASDHYFSNIAGLKSLKKTAPHPS